MADDKVTAGALAGLGYLRACIEAAVVQPEAFDLSVLLGHVRKLADGYDALIKLADDWDTEGARADALAEKRPAPASLMLSGRAQAHKDCATALRAAVASALTGKEDADA